MTPGDKALERLITEATNALHMTADPRIAQAQKFLVGLRSAEQIEHMERKQGIGQPVYRVLSIERLL